MALTLTTPPQTEPISVAEAKALGRIDQRDEDDLIASLIRAARLELDGPSGWLGRALITQQWTWTMDRFPAPGDDSYLYGPRPGFMVPLPPLQSIVSITYRDTAGVNQTLPPASYTVDPVSQPGRVLLPPTTALWPATQVGAANTVTVTFTAGYGAQPGSVPERIRDWLKRYVVFKYETRQVGPTPSLAFWELADYRIAWCM